MGNGGGTGGGGEVMTWCSAAAGTRETSTYYCCYCYHYYYYSYFYFCYISISIISIISFLNQTLKAREPKRLYKLLLTLSAAAASRIPARNGSSPAQGLPRAAERSGAQPSGCRRSARSSALRRAAHGRRKKAFVSQRTRMIIGDEMRVERTNIIFGSRGNNTDWRSG